MVGKLGILGVAAILAFTTGCTMCCHPYDNCGPVFDASCGEPYCANARAGSILEGGGGTAAAAGSPEIIEENPQGVSSAIKRLPATESEPRMLSTTEQKMGTTAGISKPHSTHRTVRQAGDYLSPKTNRW
jgi:hypothetical protein